jgi:hypothetical protein
MSHNNPPVRNAVLACLREHGPMTMMEVAETLQWPVERVHSAISGARKRYPGQLVHIVAYRKHPERGKDVSVFKAGPGEDKPRPVLTKQQKAARRRVTQTKYNRKNRTLIDTRARIKRAKAKGVEVVSNPWLHLMPPSVRSYAVQQARMENT